MQQGGTRQKVVNFGRARRYISKRDSLKWFKEVGNRQYRRKMNQYTHMTKYDLDLIEKAFFKPFITGWDVV